MKSRRRNRLISRLAVVPFIVASFGIVAASPASAGNGICDLAFGGIAGNSAYRTSFDHPDCSTNASRARYYVNPIVGSRWTSYNWVGINPNTNTYTAWKSPPSGYGINGFGGYTY